MKTHKRLLALALSFVLILLPLSPTQSQAAERFTDVQGHWAIKPIKWAMNNNFLAGYEDNTFRPNKSITKAEFISLVNRTTVDIAKSSATSVDVGFKDIKKSDWFYEEIQKAVKAGYIDKSSGNTLNANEAITRGEAASMFLEAKGLDGNTDTAMNRYSDTAKMNDLVLFSVGGLADLGIMGGYPDGTFKPGGTLSRAEVVSMFQRYFEATGEKPTPLPPTPSTPVTPMSDNWYWSFNNSGGNFMKAYTILPEDWEILERANLSPADLQQIRADSEDSDWGGSCFGFSMTTGLYQSGKFSVKGLGQNTDQISQIKATADYKAQSAINMYMNTQQIPRASEFFRNVRYFIIGDPSKTATNAANKAKEYIDAYKAGKAEPPMIGYYFVAGGGHSVMAYDYVDKGDVLELKIYDNAPGDLTSTTVLIDRGNNAVFASTNGSSEALAVLEVHTASEYANAIGGPFMQPAAQNNAKNSKNYLTTRSDKAVDVTTSTGQKVTLTPKSPDAIPLFDRDGYNYVLPGGNNFTLEGPGANEVQVRIADDLAVVDTDKVSSVHVTPTSVDLSGQSGDVKVSLTNDKAPAAFGKNTIEVSGSNTGSLNITQEGDGYQVTGDDLSNVTVSAVSGNEGTAVSIPGGENSVYIETQGDKVVVNPPAKGAPPTVDFTGKWVNLDGDFITFTQNGSQASYTTYLYGSPAGTFNGTVSGNTFTYGNGGPGGKTVITMEQDGSLILTVYDEHNQPIFAENYLRGDNEVG